MTERELLRRLVLQAPDGYRGEISSALRAIGYPVGWANVQGQALVVYLGGQEPNRPVMADELEASFGGKVTVGSNPTDRGWYVWSWKAPLDAEEKGDVTR